MKTFFTSLLLIFLFTSTTICQQQIQNPGFELWEDAGTSVDEPTDWSSIKTSDDPFYNNLAPVVWGKSTDAHSGNYSISLFNVGSLVIATGTISNGRYHTQLPADSSYVFTDIDNDQWHSTLTERPDSVVGWYKCNPTVGDFGTVKFVLHTGLTRIPGDESNYIAIAYRELPSEQITEWTRFSIPFVYSSSSNPRYCLSILTSGNGVNAFLGSTALFDDLRFVYNESSVNELTQNNFNVYFQNNLLNVEIEDNTSEPYSFELHDINGRIIHKQNISSIEKNRIEVSHVPSGIYIIVATSSNNTFTKKVLINR